METTKLAHYEELCRRQGLALTVQRRFVLQELVERKDHPTADQIYEVVRERLPGLSRTTVYRILDTLVQVGAARKVFHVDAVARYDPVTERHHHLVCTVCGRLVDVDASSVGDIRFPDLRRVGFSIDDYSINFTGVCSQCQKHNSSGGGKDGKGPQRKQDA